MIVPNEIISQEILKLRELFVESGFIFRLPEDKDIYESINNGFCYEFAIKLLDNLRINQTPFNYIEIEYNNIPHGFVFLNGLYWDSTSPLWRSSLDEA